MQVRADHNRHQISPFYATIAVLSKHVLTKFVNLHWELPNLRKEITILYALKWRSIKRMLLYCMKRLENNFQLTDGPQKFNISHLYIKRSNKRKVMNLWASCQITLSNYFEKTFSKLYRAFTQRFSVQYYLMSVNEKWENLVNKRLIFLPSWRP